LDKHQTLNTIDANEGLEKYNLFNQVLRTGGLTSPQEWYEGHPLLNLGG